MFETISKLIFKTIILSLKTLIMCKWICCCFPQKDKKFDNKKKTKKPKKKDKNDDKQKETDKTDVSNGDTQEIESFYGKKEETKPKKPMTELERDSVTPSEIPDSELTRTYDLPFENCYTIKDLMKHLGFEFQSQVGKGGFGLVRKCYYTDKKSGEKKVLASKEIKLTKKDKMIKGLKSEIYVLKKCKHPYIIGLEDNFIINTGRESIAYLFMEFADCDTLQTEINNGPLSNAVAKRYFAQIATALVYLHRLGIAHKDLKPENILLVTNEETGLKDVRVGDFGLSQNVFNAKTGIIKTGHFGGTRGYMAPEILRLDVYREHRKVLALTFDPFKSDMWALGICLFEMLTKTLPFEYHNLSNMLDLEQSRTFTYPRSVRDSIDPNADDLIRQLLEPDVTRRIDPVGVLFHPWVKDEVNFSLINVSKD